MALDPISYKKAKDVQEQLNQAIADGDQLAETQQARVDNDGNAHVTLKERIDSDVSKLKTKDDELSSQLAQTANFIGEPLTNYILSGESVPNDGVVDAHTILQRAVNTLGDLYDTDGIPRQLVLPKGIYRLDSAIQWRSGIGLKGASREETVLLPYGAVSAIIARQSEPVIWYENCHFEDFTVDGINQASTPNDYMAKAIYIQFIRKSRFERLNIKNIWMTGLGIDWVDDVWIVDCYATNCGRGGDIDRRFGSGAGIGIATGYMETESCTIINCVSTNNRTHGFFTETSSIMNINSKGFKLIGCYASGNASGFCDSGSRSAIISNCVFEKNITGVESRPSRPGGSHGIDGLVSGCVISKNTESGITLFDLYNGGYQVTNNQIIENSLSGIDIRRYNQTGVIKPLTIKGNLIKGNGQRGIIFTTTSEVEKPLIADNEIVDNGIGEDSSRREAIRIVPKLNYPTIRNNRIYNNDGGLQNHAIAFDNTIKSPVIIGNEVDVIGYLLFGNYYKIDDHRYIKDNIERASSEKLANATWSDDFNRTDGNIEGQTTSSGVGVWALNTSASGGTYTAKIVSNQLSVTGTYVYAFIDSTFADGTLEATCAKVGVGHMAKLVGRIGGNLGYNIMLKARVTSTDYRWCLVRRENGVETTLAILDAQSADGDVLKMVFEKDQLTVYINGETKYFGILDKYVLNSKFGVMSTAGYDDVLWDNISFTPIV